MKEKKPSWLERYEARQREQVTHSTGIHFTPGVPTEDGWYVCIMGYGYDIVEKVTNNAYFVGESHIDPASILSHAKLPEL